jgi:hypothetical protein
MDPAQTSPTMLDPCVWGLRLGMAATTAAKTKVQLKLLIADDPPAG